MINQVLTKASRKLYEGFLQLNKKNYSIKNGQMKIRDVHKRRSMNGQ